MITVKVDATALRRQLYRMFHDVDQAGGDVATMWAGHVQQHAVDHVAVDTGFLAVHIDKRVSKAKMSAQVGVTEPDGYYGQFVEKGTSSMQAQPWLEPAFDDGNDHLGEFTRIALDRWLPE